MVAYNLLLYESWLFMRGSNYKALTGKILIMDSLMGGGLLLEVVIHGSSTVLQCHVLKIQVQHSEFHKQATY